MLLTRYYSGDQLKETEMGVVCSMYEVEGRCIKDFGGGNLRERGDKF